MVRNAGCGPARAGLPDACGAVEAGAASPSAPACPQAAALEKEVAELRHALVSRAVLDIARGIVMATGQCSSGQAWQVLVDTSQRTNTKLRDIASGIVASVDGPVPSEPVRTAMREALNRIDEGRHRI